MRTGRYVLTLALAGVAALWGTTLGARPRRGTPQALLARKLPKVRLARMPLMRVLDHYSKLSGLPIQADWPGLEIVGITKETPVTLRAEGLSLSKLLDLTLDGIAPKGNPLSWYLSGGVVHVTTQMRAVLRNRYRIPALARPTAPRKLTPARGIRELNFTRQPLHLVLGFLRDLSGANFHVNWRALEAVGVTRETPVTVHARGISIARALDLVLDQLNVGRDRYSSVYWLVSDGMVKISTGEAFNRTTKVRIYDVADLLMVVPNFKGPRINLSSSSNVSNNTSNTGIGLFGDDDDDDDDNAEEESPSQQREKLKEALIETIKMSIGEDMWAPQGKGSIKFLRDKLVIAQTPLGFKLLEQAFRR